jgi:hypothetical protein
MPAADVTRDSSAIFAPTRRNKHPRHAPRRRGIQYAAAFGGITAAGGYVIIRFRG